MADAACQVLSALILDVRGSIMLVPLEKSKERCELLCISLQMLHGEGSAIVSSGVRARAVLSPVDPEVQSRRPVFGEARVVPRDTAPPSCW